MSSRRRKTAEPVRPPSDQPYIYDRPLNDVQQIISDNNNVFDPNYKYPDGSTPLDQACTAQVFLHLITMKAEMREYDSNMSDVYQNFFTVEYLSCLVEAKMSPTSLQEHINSLVNDANATSRIFVNILKDCPSIKPEYFLNNPKLKYRMFVYLQKNYKVNINAIIDNSGNSIYHNMGIILNPTYFKSLVSSSANLNIANMSGHTPLHIATQTFNTIAIRTLLDAKADIKLLKPNFVENTCYYQDTRIPSLLLQYKATIPPELPSKPSQFLLNIHRTNTISKEYSHLRLNIIFHQPITIPRDIITNINRSHSIMQFIPACHDLNIVYDYNTILYTSIQYNEQLAVDILDYTIKMRQMSTQFKYNCNEKHLQLAIDEYKPNIIRLILQSLHPYKPPPPPRPPLSSFTSSMRSPVPDYGISILPLIEHGDLDIIDIIQSYRFPLSQRYDHICPSITHLPDLVPRLIEMKANVNHDHAVSMALLKTPQHVPLLLEHKAPIDKSFPSLGHPFQIALSQRLYDFARLLILPDFMIDHSHILYAQSDDVSTLFKDTVRLFPYIQAIPNRKLHHDLIFSTNMTAIQVMDILVENYPEEHIRRDFASYLIESGRIDLFPCILNAPVKAKHVDYELRDGDKYYSSIYPNDINQPYWLEDGKCFTPTRHHRIGSFSRQRAYKKSPLLCALFSRNKEVLSLVINNEKPDTQYLYQSIKVETLLATICRHELLEPFELLLTNESFNQSCRDIIPHIDYIQFTHPSDNNNRHYESLINILLQYNVKYNRSTIAFFSRLVCKYVSLLVDGIINDKHITQSINNKYNNDNYNYNNDNNDNHNNDNDHDDQEYDYYDHGDQEYDDNHNNDNDHDDEDNDDNDNNDNDNDDNDNDDQEYDDEDNDDYDIIYDDSHDSMGHLLPSTDYNDERDRNTDTIMFSGELDDEDSDSDYSNPLRSKQQECSFKRKRLYDNLDRFEKSRLEYYINLRMECNFTVYNTIISSLCRLGIVSKPRDMNELLNEAIDRCNVSFVYAVLNNNLCNIKVITSALTYTLQCSSTRANGIILKLLLDHYVKYTTTNAKKNNNIKSNNTNNNNIKDDNDLIKPLSNNNTLLFYALDQIYDDDTERGYATYEQDWPEYDDNTHILSDYTLLPVPYDRANRNIVYMYDNTTITLTNYPPKDLLFPHLSPHTCTTITSTHTGATITYTITTTTTTTTPTTPNNEQFNINTIYRNINNSIYDREQHRLYKGLQQYSTYCSNNPLSSVKLLLEYNINCNQPVIITDPDDSTSITQLYPIQSVLSHYDRNTSDYKFPVRGNYNLPLLLSHNADPNIISLPTKLNLPIHYATNTLYSATLLLQCLANANIQYDTRYNGNEMISPMLCFTSQGSLYTWLYLDYGCNPGLMPADDEFITSGEYIAQRFGRDKRILSLINDSIGDIRYKLLDYYGSMELKQDYYSFGKRYPYQDEL